MLLYVALFQHNKLIQQKTCFYLVFLARCSLCCFYAVFMHNINIYAVYSQFLLFPQKALDIFRVRSISKALLFIVFTRFFFRLNSVFSFGNLLLFQKVCNDVDAPAPIIIITSPALAVSLIFSPPSRNLSRIRRGARFRRHI